MSELLTTGEMIDRLKVGEIAEANELNNKRATKNERGGIIDVDTGNNIILNHIVISLKWRILPNYVSFSEAMKVLREGGPGTTVTFYHRGRGYKIEHGEYVRFKMSSYEFKEFSFGSLFEGKWTIEEG